MTSMHADSQKNLELRKVKAINIARCIRGGYPKAKLYVICAIHVIVANKSQAAHMITLFCQGVCLR